MGREKKNAMIRQHTEKKQISPLIVLLTFLMGAAAAFAAFLGIRASKDKKNAGRAGSVGAAGRDSMQEGRELNDLLRQLRSEYERRDSLERDIARSDLKVYSVQTQKIKPYRPRKRVSVKKVIGRSVAVAVAVALVVTGLYVMPYDSKMLGSTVQAKSSFGGIKQVVDEHNEKNPFVILDIVPGKAYSADKKYEFSLGTIGYLAPGQSPIQQDLVRIFTGEDKANFYAFSARKALTDSVMGSGYEGISYQEAYGGMGEDLRSSMWSQIYDPAEIASGGDGQPPATYSTGELYAYVQRRPDAEGADAGSLPSLAGYNYDLIWPSNGSIFGNAVMSSAAAVGDVFTFAPDGEGKYQVFFEGPTMGTSGYRPELLMSGSYDEVILGGNYSDATGVYVVENGVYRYASTIGEMKGIPRPEPEQPTDPTPIDPEPTDPTPTDPEPTDPEPTDPEPTDPTPTDPEPTDPEPTDPTPIDPEPTDPTPTDPEPTDPTPIDPEPTNPEPTDPTPTNPEQPQPEQPQPEQPQVQSEQQVQFASQTAGKWHYYVEIMQPMNEGEPQPEQPAPEQPQPEQPEQPQPEPPAPEPPQPEQPQPEPPQPEPPQPEQPQPEPSAPEPPQPEQPQPEPPEPEQPDSEQPQPEQPQPEPEQPEQQPALDLEEGTYCIIKFTYVETQQEELLYQVKESSKFYSTEGQPRPYDTYHLERGVSQNGFNAALDTELNAVNPAVVGSFRYVGDGKGMYKLTKAGSTQKVTELTGLQPIEREIEYVNTQGAQEYYEIAAAGTSSYYIEVQNAPVYIRCTSGKDYLRKHVFNSLKAQDNASDDFAIRVNTVLAGDVTYEMVQEANLVYLEDGMGLYFDQNTPKGYIYTEEKGNADDGVGDISDTVIMSLLYGAVEESKPVIVDYGIVTNENDYADTKYQKLAKVFLKQDLAAFYNAMAKSDDLANSALMNADKESTEYPNKKDNDYHYVNRNIYIVNGSTPLVADDFPDAIDKTAATAGFTEVLAAIRAENVMLSDDEKIAEEVSKAMAVQYIINFSRGLVGEYKDLSILELQPTANIEYDLHYDASADKERVVLYWRRQDQSGEGQQILRSSRKIQIDRELCSVAAFNTSYEDINEAYNMIFIGLDGQRLYRELDKDNMLQTVYNDPDLNGKVYHRGDRVAGIDVRYDENDITVEKKNALLDYLRAGYPIVVENDCFTGGSARKAEAKDINTKYIAKDTQMYAFFEEAIAMRADQKDGEESDVGLYTIEDVHSSAMFAMQLKALRPKVELQRENDAAPDGGENGDEEQNEQIGMIPAEPVEDQPGVIRGTFAYRISSDKTGDDRAYGRELDRHLYLDLNYDGIFAPEEEIAGYQHEQTADGGTISVDFNEINSGIVPWKLEVADHGNQYRRAATQGYFTITGNDKTKIRVLQILDDKKNDYANFEEQYKRVENSMLAYYLKAAEGRANIAWDIKTVEPSNGKDGLKELLDKNPNYLSLWDVVVLGFGESRNPGEMVTTAVNDFVAAGGSVLLSSAGAAEETGRFGLSTAVLGQKDGKTYGKLGLHSPSQYRYKGIDAYMFNKTPSLFLDCINEGVIAQWPLQVNTRAQLGSATKVSMPDYLLDIGEEGGTGQPRTTAWFTLLDTGASSDGSTAGGYSVSPRDGRNNYYVYSKGNVVYVGQSQYPYIYDKESGKGPEGDGLDECKIFVNALMAAYNGGVHRANVSIVAGFNGVNKVESVTIPYDVAFKEGEQSGDAKGGILGDTVDVYFRFTDNNIAVDKTTRATFYYKNAGAAENATLLLPDGGINGTDYTDFTARTPIWTVENNRLVEVTDGSVVPGKVYRIKAPLEAMQAGEEEQSQICVLLTNSYTRAGQIVEAFSLDSVSLNRAQMFLLE